MKRQYKYWGKSRKLDDGRFVFHLLPLHCLDASSVGELLIDNYFKRKSLLSDISLPEKIFIKSIYLFFLSLHDIGKFSITFQNLQPEILYHLQKIKSNKTYEVRHDQLGWIAYESFLRDLILNKISNKHEAKNFGDIFDVFASIAFGHHGTPPSSKMESMSTIFNDNDRGAMCDFCDDCFNSFLQDRLQNIHEISLLGKNEFKTLKNNLKMISWELAGITVIADWIVSSDEYWFNSKEIGDIPIGDYRRSVLPLSKEAVTKAGILPSMSSHETGLSRIFPQYADAPTPLQNYCNQVPIAAEPQLWILEDVTGAGKTEASLTLASRIMSKGLADGVFIALPTMATSNAMYERMGDVYWRLFDDKESPSLVLSHGSRHLSEKFQNSYRDHIISGNVDNEAQNEEANEGKVHCSRWIADSSKKALLADTGVGTIDQVLLSVLPVRYQSLRYYGMSRKVLIFDEVHSYDTYMLRILETVLTGHASAGGNVILLSATLPSAIRERLVAAYRQGLNEDNDCSSLKEKGYPLATGIINNLDPVETVIETRREVKRTVPVMLLENIEKVVDTIKETVKKEQCVCWIRNTVTDVFEAYDLLKPVEEISVENIDVFHSQFALHDRIQVENEVRRRFGKDSGHEERKGRVLLATQVVEQSLDLDFDVLISDLAPIDLLIQRAGRLHRHLRDYKGNRVSVSEEASRPSPVYYVLIPPETENPEEVWFSNAFPRAAYVYEDTAVLWRTKEIIKKEKTITMPERARCLIEAVYGSEAIALPEVFLVSEGEAWADQLSKNDLADFNILKLFRGYSIESSHRWDEEERVPTRLGDARQNVYLFMIENEEVVPLYSGEFAWEMSSLKVRRGKMSINPYKESTMKKIAEMKRKYRLRSEDLFLQVRGDVTLSDGRKIVYNDKFGLRIIK